MNRLDLNTPSNINGLLFGADGKITAFTICSNKMMQVICHGLSEHYVTSQGGFHAGKGSYATAGVALGKDAISDQNGEGIDCIQLGTGTNSTANTLKVYDYNLLGSDGKIPSERLPNLNIEMEIVSNVLSWRYVGDTTWIPLLDVTNLQGEDGQSFQVDEYGNLDEAKLVEIANNITTGRYLFLVNPSGDIRADNTTPASLNGDMSRHILMYDGDSQEWFDYGEFTGLQGDPGTPIELQNNGTYIQWKYTTDATWTNLITLANLKGDKGDKGEDGANGLNLELDGTDVNYIRWRVVGDSTWINLVNKSTLIGATGDKGEDGTPAKVIKLVPSSTVFKDSNKDVALSFNGSSDYVKLSSVSALNNILNGAKQVRINCGITPENNSSDYGMIFCIVEVGISIRVENGYIYINSRALKQAVAYGLHVAPFTKGVYYDIDVTFDYENSEVVVIINNTTYTESINFESSTYQGNTLTQSYVYLGNHQVAGRAFKGKIHYLTIEKDNVEVLNMPMNEGTGSIIYDKRNGNNGTINGATWVNTVTTTPTTINVSGLSQGTTISNWQYSLNGGTYSNTAPFGVNRTNNNVEILGKSLEANTISIKAYNGDVSDIVTISKYKDGEDGIDGAKGDKGEDGREIELRVNLNGFLEYRYVGGTTWTVFFDLKDLTVRSNTNSTLEGDGSIETPFGIINKNDGLEYVNRDGIWVLNSGGGGGGYEPKNSIEVDTNELQLVGDESTPGNSKYYGTDETGIKGYHTIPQSGEYNTIETISLDGTTLTPDVDKNVEIALNDKYVKLDQSTPQTLSASPIFGSMTPGRLIVVNVDDSLIDIGELTWDNTNNRLKIGNHTVLSDSFVPAIGALCDLENIAGLDFKNSNVSGQVRLMARNNQDDYIAMNVAGSSVTSTLFGLLEKDISALFQSATTDTDKVLIIGTINAGALGLGTSNAIRVWITAGGNVGIDTKIPTKKLDVAGTSGYVAVGNEGTTDVDFASRKTAKTFGKQSLTTKAPVITVWAESDYRDGQIKTTKSEYYNETTLYYEQRFDWDVDFSVKCIEIKDDITGLWVQRNYTWTDGIPSVSETIITTWTI